MHSKDATSSGHQVAHILGGVLADSSLHKLSEPFRFLGCSNGNTKLQLPPQIFLGQSFADWLGHFTVLLFQPPLCCLGRMFCSLSS